jgi:hypothetical protein
MTKDEALERKAENARELGLDYEPDWKEEYQKAVDLHCITLDELREANVTRQRRWQGLTDEEISNLWSWSMTREAELTATTQQHAFAQAIEAKLKEKNT